MKKYSIIRIAVLSAYICLHSSVFAQSVTGDPVASADASRFHASRSVNADATAKLAIRARNTKMFNNFSKSFAEASDIRISTEPDGTRISCKTGETLNKILYDHKGNWVYTVRYYDYNQLPDDIAKQVAEAYPQYEIYGFVSEVNVPGKQVHMVMIENRSSWKRVRVADGDIEPYEEYKKP